MQRKNTCLIASPATSSPPATATASASASGWSGGNHCTGMNRIWICESGVQGSIEMKRINDGLPIAAAGFIALVFAAGAFCAWVVM